MLRARKKLLRLDVDRLADPGPFWLLDVGVSSTIAKETELFVSADFPSSMVLLVVSIVLL